MRKRPLLLLILIAIVFIGACEKKAAIVIPLTIDFTWTKENECRDFSPELRIGNIPENTVALRIQMEDLYYHGGDHGPWEELAYDGSGRIPAGAMPLFRGPCPPAVAQNLYQFTVKALDAEGVVIGKGQQAKKCCNFQ